MRDTNQHNRPHGNTPPTEESVRGKVERGGALFATDEIRLLLDEIDALRAWARGDDLPVGWIPPGYEGPTYVA